ncbi:MAG: hypothetical protein JWR85_3836 [Marmoricola sp.]|nr:hypothetical protein [Marmoricola sp.]
MRDKMGIYFDKKRDKFIVRKVINGKRTYIGQRHTLAEAQYLELQQNRIDYETEDTSENWFEKLLAVFKKKN